MREFIFALIFAVALSGGAAAKVRLPAIVGDNMVLQQDTLVNVWGWADPGKKVTVSASWGVKKSAVTGQDGKWLLQIKTPKASFEKYTMTVSDGTPVTLKNILVGEVWLCSGQSNMQMMVEGGRDCPIENSQKIIVGSINYPDVRLFTVQLNGGLEPREDVTGQWDEASPSVVKQFSAIGYLFGRNLQDHLHVPVGIINSSCGGTWIEAWFPASLQTGFADYDPASIPTAEGQSGMTKMELLYNGMIAPIKNYAVKGFLWYQGCTNAGRSDCYAEKMVALIKHWRDIWGGASKPFYYVELAPHEDGFENLRTALVREEQAKVMDMIENVGMVCTNDLVYDYESWNVHPSRKEPIAERLLYWALSKTYGYGDAIKTIGPRFKSMELLDGGVLKVSFHGSECGFIVDGPIEGFEVAGPDGIFYPAQALRHRPDPTVLYVSAYNVGRPVYLRYNFKNWAPGHLWDAFGQPVVPFRTDNFKIHMNNRPENESK